MAVLAACGLLDSEPKALRQAYERQGLTPLPPLLGNRVDVAMGGPSAGAPLKSAATEAAPQIDPAELDRYLRHFAREIGEPHVAVFGILDDETGLYTYRYARVKFNKVGARTMVHLIPDPDDPTIIRGIAAAQVPDDPESMRQWTEFILPQRDTETRTKAPANQEGCQTYKVTEYYWQSVCGSNGCSWTKVVIAEYYETECTHLCKVLGTAGCSDWGYGFNLPPAGSETIETHEPTRPKPCKGDPLPVMKIRPTAPGNPLESGRHRPCVGQNCAPGTKAVRIEGGVLKGHFGIDLACELGDPVYAPFDGSYNSGGWQVAGNGRGYGRFVQFVSNFDDGERLYWGFSHMEDARFFVRTSHNQGRVNAGDIIGYCGRTGYEDGGTHTHMEMGRGPVFSSRSRSELVNPESRLTTTFNTAGTPTTPTNCPK